MQNKKVFPTEFGPWSFLGAEIEKMIYEASGPAVRSSHILATITVAIEPETLAVAVRDAQARPLADAFNTGLARNPDLIMSIFKAVRSKWHNPKPSHADVVKKFMASNPWLPVQKDNGKVELRILVKSVSDKELSRTLELVGCGKIETGTIKGARQDWRFPKQNLNWTMQLHAAFKYLKSLGFCQYC